MADSSVSNVVVASHSFGAIIEKLNLVITLVNTKVVTSQANSSGALTSGNVNIIGLFFANGIYTGTGGLQGGVFGTPAVLPIGSNVVITGVANVSGNVAIGGNLILTGILTSNLTVTGALVNIQTTEVSVSANAGTVGVQANLINFVSNTFSFTGDLTVTGNVTVNGSISAPLSTHDHSNATNGGTTIKPLLINVGTYSVNTTVVAFGNSTVNSVANSSQVVLSDAVASLLLSTSLVSVSNALCNVNITPDSIALGNSTVNGVVNSSMVILVGNSFGNAVMTATNFSTGNSSAGALLNRTSIDIANTMGSAQMNPFGFSVGANVVLTRSLLRIGNSTVNCTINSSSLFVGRQINNSQFNAFGSRTVSLSDPTGGADGDIWYVVAA